MLLGYILIYALNEAPMQIRRAAMNVLGGERLAPNAVSDMLRGDFLRGGITVCENETSPH